MTSIKNFLQFSLIFILLYSLTLNAEENEAHYIVKFTDIQKDETLQLLQSASELVKLNQRPPKTRASLRRRAELDLPNLVKALHSQAYYNAKITFDVDFTKTPFEVLFNIETGPVYPLASFEVLPESLNILPEDLGICLYRPAYPSDIIAAEENLIHVLNRMGYPLSTMVDREVIADQNTKEIRVKLQVDPGPLAHFGKVIIDGNTCVKNAFIKQKIFWRCGDVYDPSKIECTMSALESAGVFSSISITNGEELAEDGQLPITIQVKEGNQRSIGLGIGYSTQRGPGFTAQWEHRNFGGMGEKLRVSANVLKEMQEGGVSYLMPDFLSRGQDLIHAAEVEHDDTKGYEKTSFSLSSILERQLTNCLRISFGGMYEYLKSTEENKDGSKDTETFNLARIPLKLRWSTVDDPLDPKCGSTIFLKAIPSFQLFNDALIYTISTLTASIYKPVSRENRLILAAKMHLGSIWGTSRDTIPGSDRFNAGSENTLRGYNYHTVSPLSDDADPLGGRSMMIYTLEGRWRLSNKWGTAVFYDVGNVYTDPIPKFDSKMLQSVGLGFRYYTPVGPLRLDFAYPLNRRYVFDKKAMKKRYIDSPYQIYFSVGQSF